MIQLHMGKHFITCIIITLLILNGVTAYAAFPVQPEAVAVSAEAHATFKEKVQTVAEKYKAPAPVNGRTGSAEGSGWMGITALSLGIAGLGLLIAGFMSASLGGLILAGISAAIMAIIFGAIGLKKKNGGMAMAGMILGIAEIIGLVLLVVIAVAAFSGL